MRERIEIAALLDENPSLRPGLSDSLAGADQKARKLAEISLRRHGEWTLQVGRAIGDTRFTEAQVLGGWLPKVEGQGSP